MKMIKHTILIVEDDVGLLELISEKIECYGYQIATIQSALKAIEWLSVHSTFLMILDYGLPDMNGKEFIEKLKTKDILVPPFIVCTGQGDERVAVDMMKLGARDYIIKDSLFLEMMPLVVCSIAKMIENENKLKLTEQKLIESAQFNKQIIESVQEGVVVFDRNLKCQVWNPFMVNLSGLHASEVIDKYPMDRFPFFNDSGVLENTRKTILEKYISEIEIPFNFPITGKSGWVSETIAPLVNIVGEVNGAITTIRDITERKQAEDEISLKNEQLLKLNAEKDKFFSIISHDLRGPFSSFLGLTEIMADDLPSLTMDEIQKFSVSLRNSATNLFHLLENLLQWSRMQQGLIPFNPELIKLQLIIDECMMIMQEPAKNKGISISSEISDDIEIPADRYMLQTIIRNLVSNALKFTPKGGKINILAKATPNKSVEISITDTGIGMSQAMIDNLFRLEGRINRSGTDGEPSTGLGLILCKEFVEKLGGKIWVESEEEKGTRFYFVVPKG